MDNIEAVEDVFEGPDKLVRGSVAVEWVELGEGMSGDYNEDDPGDVELLRFDVLAHIPSVPALAWQADEAGDDGWANLIDGSYCTRFPARSEVAERQAALRFLMEKVYEPVLEDGYKKVCERLSWIGPEWLSDDTELRYLSGAG